MLTNFVYNIIKDALIGTSKCYALSKCDLANLILIILNHTQNINLYTLFKKFLTEQQINNNNNNEIINLFEPELIIPLITLISGNKIFKLIIKHNENILIEEIWEIILPLLTFDENITIEQKYKLIKFRKELLQSFSLYCNNGPCNNDCKLSNKYYISTCCDPLIGQ